MISCRSWRIGFAAFLGFVLVVNAVSQESRADAPLQPQAAPNAAASSGTSRRLLIGVGDDVDVSVYGVPELSQHARVGDSGEIYLPLVGKVTVGGLTSEEAQAAIEKKYAEGNFLKEPHVTVSVSDYTTQGVTILGEVLHPGTYSVVRARRLYDAFLIAGGLTQRAGNTVAITHARSQAKPEVVSLSADPLKSSENNRDLQPGDTVIVARAGIVYMVGEVNRPGGFVIDTPDGKISMAQVLAMASGPTRAAKLSRAKLLRRTGTGLESKEIDLQKILDAKREDLPLQAEDIVFVPASRGKLAAERGAGSILNMLSNLAIYRF